MKNIILTAACLCFLSITVFAQHDHNSHQKQTSSSTTEANSKNNLSPLLTLYYNIKNALVAGDAGSAASNADAFVKNINTIDYKVISEGNINILAKDAGRISETKDIKKQREYFANFSANMATVAKATKLSDQPIYLQYCPMKKASWLSNEKEIRNPYYGSAMLTCGEITETL